MNNELRQLNFNDLIILSSSISLATYDFNVYLQNKRHFVNGYCLRCEEKGCNICPQDANFKLKNISHGASSDDILLATKQNGINFDDWHDEGILFLMEGPSKDYDIYEEISFNGYLKKPSKQWYWVHNEQEKYSYPEKFKGRKYGKLFNSLIFTFKLKNAYLTNLIKCGLNNDDDGYKGIDNYNNECINTCFESFLNKEIAILKPKVIFCFGSSVLKRFKSLYKLPAIVIGLPHPAGAQRGFKNEFYRHLYFSMILEGLFKANIYTSEEACRKYDEFLKLAPGNGDSIENND
jgi:hypothetical protein